MGGEAVGAGPSEACICGSGNRGQSKRISCTGGVGNGFNSNRTSDSVDGVYCGGRTSVLIGDGDGVNSSVESGEAVAALWFSTIDGVGISLSCRAANRNAAVVGGAAGIIGGDKGRSGEKRIDGQVEGDHRIAACSVGEYMSVFAAGCDVGMLVPVKGVASYGRGVTSTAVIDGQIQGNH